jgi:hypothetical protein
LTVHRAEVMDRREGEEEQGMLTEEEWVKRELR